MQDAALEALARRAADVSGVTRFAEITGLDTIGVPVWQAIRPWSRSVSVHQGKGLTEGSARISACLEAFECHLAESWQAPEPFIAAHEDLPPDGRLTPLAGFGGGGAALPSEPMRWTAAERLGGNGPVFVPTGFVSLDLTAPRSWLRQSSNGQGAGTTLEQATLKGLCELIERDAFRRWAGTTAVERMLTEFDPGSIAVDWFGALHERLARQDVRLRVYHLPGAIDLPVVAAELVDLRSTLRSRSLAAGTCAHPDPTLALLGAVTEAAQARLGQIAGSREDLDPFGPVDAINAAGFAIPRPADTPGRDFVEAMQRARSRPNRTAAELAAELEARNFGATARIDLRSPLEGITVVKIVNPRLPR